VGIARISEIIITTMERSSRLANVEGITIQVIWKKGDGFRGLLGRRAVVEVARIIKGRT